MLNFSIAANFHFGRELKVVSCAVYQSLIPEALFRSSDFQWDRSANYELKPKNQHMHKDNITVSEHQEKKTGYDGQEIQILTL